MRLSVAHQGRACEHGAATIMLLDLIRAHELVTHEQVCPLHWHVSSVTDGHEKQSAKTAPPLEDHPRHPKRAAISPGLKASVSPPELQGSDRAPDTLAALCVVQ